MCTSGVLETHSGVHCDGLKESCLAKPLDDGPSDPEAEKQGRALNPLVLAQNQGLPAGRAFLTSSGGILHRSSFANAAAAKAA